MAAGIYDGWTIEEGSKFSGVVRYPGISSAVGYTARMHIRSGKTKSSNLILALTTANSRIALSSSGGKLVITLTISASDTSNLPFEVLAGDRKLGYFDLEVIPSTGEADAFRALQGQIYYSPERTG